MRLGVLAPLGAVAGSGALAAQQTNGAQDGNEEEGTVPTFVGGTSLVVLHVTVADKDDRIVTDLTRENFEVYENGDQMPLRLFRREDVPVSVGLVIDNSGSMRDKRRKVNNAALEFVKASNPEDEIFIVNFNDELHRDTPFTSDLAELQDALQLIDSRGGTAFYDALLASLDHMKEKAKHDKRVLLAISDGEDNASRTELELLVRELQEQESQTIIYAIGLLSEEEKRSAKRAERAIKNIAHATGGPAYFPETADEVAALTKKIAFDIRNQYTLTYAPPEDGEPGFRQVKVELTGKKAKKLQARYRPGYFAQ